MTVLNFLWKQIEILSKEVRDGKLSSNESSETLTKLIEQVRREERYAFERGLSELRQINEREAAISSSQRLTAAIRAFGGVIQNSTVNNTTYIINGRVINCTTFQNTVNCN